MAPYQTKFDLILEQERQLARTVACTAIKPARLSVWDVMIPFIFISGYLKQKQSRELCVHNLLFTKTLALEAARAMAQDKLSRDDAIQRADAETRKVLATAAEDIYSDAVREKQMAEIALLVDHYQRLLTARGDNYPALVATAYENRSDFIRFLSSLQQAEQEVARAAQQLLGDRADDAMRQCMAHCSQQVRQRWVDTIFA